MKNVSLRSRTVADIDSQVVKILKGLGNPEPPVDLRVVRELLKLDQGYYSTTDDSLLRETFSRLKVAGLQVLLRPTLLRDAVRSLSLKALYLPDQKRILLDKDLPILKHRWNEAHEIGHDIIPWHEGMMLGDTKQTLSPTCHEMMEAEANYAAGQLLFLGTRFSEEAAASAPNIEAVKKLSKDFGNTVTSTLWRLVEHGHAGRPMVALVTGHPHRGRREAAFDPAAPCRYCVESPAFRERFGHLTEIDLFGTVVGYCGAQRGGSLGQTETILSDRNRDGHVFSFETFYNRHEALTLGFWLRPHVPVRPAWSPAAASF
ncbi:MULTISPECIES: ImmA/IrrE family metallo-endopeptidase [Bosea]|uniref:Peptidase n=1 Tax=Bosea vaviloviae TaxID=1526658 RepID=A0A0N0MBE5_9HYPH|nr:ImmA/IrrE family metallo-endopeptidase [Bosea vaviloviae]KPH80808.1 peptidase [Bosea vaviloviae]